MTKDEAFENIRFKVRFSGDNCNFDCAFVSESEKFCMLSDECKALFKED